MQSALRGRQGPILDLQIATGNAEPGKVDFYASRPKHSSKQSRGSSKEQQKPPEALGELDPFLEMLGLGATRQKAELIHFSDAIYRGQTGCFDGKRMRHGLGVMLYASGRVFEGFWHRDQRHGKGFERYKNGDVHIGEYKKGRPEGKGKRVWYETGEAYEGEWYQGMRHGIGKWVIRHADAHLGTKTTKAATKGQDKVLISETYTGRFQNNHFEGFGIYMTKYRRVKHGTGLNLDL